MSAPRRLLWPTLLLPALIAVALLGLFLQLEQRSTTDEDLSALRDALMPLLVSGQSRGYQPRLQQYRPAGALTLTLSDREGHVLAVWPPPLALSASRWRVFSQPLQAGRQGLLHMLGQKQHIALLHQGQRVGELQLYRARGLLGMNLTAWLFLAIALLALASTLGLWRASRRAASTVPTTHVTSPQNARPEPGTWLASVGKSLDEAGLGLVQLDNQACVQAMNHRAQQLTAWPEQDAVGLPVASVLRSQPHADVSPVLDFASLEPSGVRERFDLYARNNAIVPLEISRLSLPTVEGEVAETLLLLRDVSEQQSELARFRQDAQLAAATLDLMSQGLAMTNRYGRITRTNRQLQQFTGYSAQELRGMTVAKLMPVPFLKDARIQLSHYLPDHTGAKAPVVAWRKNASTLPVDLQVQRLDEGEQAFLLLLSDKAQQQKDAALAGRLSVLMAHLPHSVLLVDAHSGYCNGASPHALQLLGYAQEQLQRMSLSHLLMDLNDDELRKQIDLLQSGVKPFLDASHRLRLADGRQVQAQLRLALSGKEQPPALLVFISPD